MWEARRKLEGEEWFWQRTHNSVVDRIVYQLMADVYIALRADGEGEVSQTGSFLNLQKGHRVSLKNHGGDVQQVEIIDRESGESFYAELDPHYRNGEERRFLIIP